MPRSTAFRKNPPLGTDFGRLPERSRSVGMEEKLRGRVEQHVEPGEAIEQVLLAQGGIPPSLSVFGGRLGTLLVHRRIVAVTDRAVLVLEADWNGTKPKRVLARLPRETRSGPVNGAWAKTTLGGERLYVNRKFHGAVTAADARIGA